MVQRPCHLLGGFPQGPRPREDKSFMDESQTDPLLQSCGWSVWRSCDLHCSVTGEDGIFFLGGGGGGPPGGGTGALRPKRKVVMGLFFQPWKKLYTDSIYPVVLQKLPKTNHPTNNLISASVSVTATHMCDYGGSCCRQCPCHPCHPHKLRLVCQSLSWWMTA